MERAAEANEPVEVTMRALNFSTSQIKYISNVCFGLTSMSPSANSELMGRARNYRTARKKLVEDYTNKIRNYER